MDGELREGAMSDWNSADQARQLQNDLQKAKTVHQQLSSIDTSDGSPLSKQVDIHQASIKMEILHLETKLRAVVKLGIDVDSECASQFRPVPHPYFFAC